MTFLFSTDRNETLDRVLLAVAAILGAGLVFLRQASYGPAMGWDSVNYVATARNLLAGEGFLDMLGPFVTWPPLYPMMLAGGGLSGLDPWAIAGPLNAVISGLTVLVAGWWMRRHVQTRFLWLWGCLSVALALPLAEIASEAMSEPAFILFVTLALTQIDAHLDGRGRASLFWAAAFSALACLTRYMGVSVILAVVPALLAARIAPGERVKRVAVYTLIAASPLALWMLRNYLAVGSTTGDRGKVFYSFGFIVGEALRIAVNDWWLVGLTAPVLLALVMAAGHGFHRLRSRKRDAPDVVWVPLRVCAGFALAYLGLLVVSMMSGGTWSGLAWRFLVPVYIPLLFAALLLMDAALRYARKQAPWGVRGIALGGRRLSLAAILLLALSLQGVWLVALHGREMPRWTGGAKQAYAEPRWRDSESIGHIREAALTGSIWSNARPVTALHAGSLRRHYALPCEPDHLLFAWSDAVDGEEAYVLHFNDPWGECSQWEDEALGSHLPQDPFLEPVAELADGKLYRLIQRESLESRPAMFLSSGPPVEGEPFVARFKKSYGRRVAGEPWRWERGDDAGGWTSLPIPSPTYAYSPTAADVGHRLRASVYYTDHLGDRVKATTKPSKPVQAGLSEAGLIFPANVDDLPHNRRPNGFDNLDFAFQWHGLRGGGG